jgi:hypothetical protein
MREAGPERGTAAEGGLRGMGADTAGDRAPITFVSFVLSLSSSALMHLGVPMPGVEERPERNLMLARQTIDVLEMLRAKTDSNLEPGERQLFDDLLHDLRMRYVEASKPS